MPARKLFRHRCDQPDPARQSSASLLMKHLLLLLGGALVFGLQLEPKLLNVDYQIHSYNDLKELRQVLVKGARRFKFDPHYVAASSQCGDDKSCFLLNHDKPVPEFANYNTSTELLEFLKSTEFAEITEGERVTVALCFKSAPDKCQNTTSFNNWLRLVDDFYFQAQSVPHQVEFILDGDAAPTKSCLVGRWEKWNSVWINSNSPAGAFWGNDQQDDYYRFQILNNPENVGNWTWMASADVNYGKFSNGSYPYQLWEPDAQEDIREYIDIYHSGAVHIPAGFHFAINIDIAMFRVYSSRYAMAHRAAHAMAALPPPAELQKSLPGCETSLSISQPLREGVTAATADASPLLVSVSDDHFLGVTVRAGTTLTVALSLVEVNRLQFTAATSSGALLSAADSDWLLVGPDSGVTLVSAVVLAGQGTGSVRVLFASSAGRLLLADVVIKDDSVDVTSSEQLTLPESLAGATLFDVSALPLASCQSAGASLCAQIIIAGSSNELMFSTLAVTSQEAHLEGSVTVVAPSTGVITSARLAQLEQDDAAVTLIFCAQDLTLYAAELAHAATPPVAWSAVTVGKHVQLSVAGAGAAQALMVVTDSGYCYTSHSHNTRAYPMVCASTPVPTETVLDYSLGLARHWLEAVRSGAAVTRTATPKSYLATVCSDKILHGSYDQGARPAVALTHTAVPHFTPSALRNESMYFFLAAHEGIPTSTPVVVTDGVRARGGGGCGDPIHRDGVVLDAFAVDSWMRTLQRVYPQ